MDEITGPSQSVFIQQTKFPISGLQIVVGEGEIFNHVDKNEYMWTGDGDRFVRRTIEFPIPFASVPLVAISITSLDASKAQNQRFRIYAENISPLSFDLMFSTWGDTKIARAGATWTATGSKKQRLKPTSLPNSTM